MSSKKSHEEKLLFEVRTPSNIPANNALSNIAPTIEKNKHIGEQPNQDRLESKYDV